MAACSMTGFGRWETRTSGVTFAVEIRSVNHRYLESSLRLPAVLHASEQKIREILQESLHRGRVTLTVEIGGDGAGEKLAADAGAVDAYLEIARRLSRERGLPGEVDIPTLLALPDVLVRRPIELCEEEVWPVVEKGLRRALAGLVQMRRREGRTLVADLRGRLKTIRTTLRRVEKRAAGRSQAAVAELRGRIEKLLDGIPINEEKVAQEAAFLADRFDCTEEVVRARSHLDQFARFLREGGAIGRKLNFLLQELHREINTIGSKASDAEIAREIVFLKEELERLREQVQNLE